MNVPFMMTRQDSIESAASEVTYHFGKIVEMDVAIQKICDEDPENVTLFEYGAQRKYHANRLLKYRSDFTREVKRSRHLDPYTTVDAPTAIKLVVLMHPKVTSEQVTSLVDDPDSDVREAARQHEKSWVAAVGAE